MKVWSAASSAVGGAVSSGVSRISPGQEREEGHSSAAFHVYHHGSAVAGMAVGVASSAAGTAVTMTRDVASQQAQKAANLAKHLRELIETWLRHKMMATTVRIVDKIPGIVKSSMDDPDMPRWVSRGKDRAIDASWPDARSEILWEMAVLLDRHPNQDEPTEKGCDCFRAFFRYHMFPYDKSFWAQMRDPFHVLFMIVPCVPIFGVNPAWFAFVFLIIDKSDEFQLIQFILGFKGTAFISQGLLRVIVGFSMFISCVTARARRDHGCETSGPGASGDVWPTFAGFLVQVVLVWIAFLLLKCSKEKGRSQLGGKLQLDQDKSAKQGHMNVKGGFIVYFLWYDLVTFLICSGIIVFAVTTRPNYDYDDWTVHQTIFASQVLYGLLSMPFFLFTLPVLQRLLTHSLPTAYDRRGRCRKPIGSVKKEEEKEPKTQEPLVSEAEIEDLYAKIKKLLPGLGSSMGASGASSSGASSPSPDLGSP
mmetsp:Transcript_168293/g.540682  ORF Transcript_168293/g.540682 Transcript_168293/m.540682 type:complete len:478 (+) Transcript_168293:98-1531(+)